MGSGKTVASPGAATEKRRLASRRKFVSLQDPTLGGGKCEFPAKEGDQLATREDAGPGEGGGEVQLLRSIIFPNFTCFSSMSKILLSFILVSPAIQTFRKKGRNLDNFKYTL